MPGKGDYGQSGDLGKYFPGDKSWKAWDEGWRYRYGGTAAQRPSTDNPYQGSLSKKAEATAWDDGWNEAHANEPGLRRMPATSGPAPT